MSAPGVGTPVIYNESGIDITCWVTVTHDSWTSLMEDQFSQPDAGHVCLAGFDWSGTLFTANNIAEGTSSGTYRLPVFEIPDV